MHSLFCFRSSGERPSGIRKFKYSHTHLSSGPRTRRSDNRQEQKIQGENLLLLSSFPRSSPLHQRQRTMILCSFTFLELAASRAALPCPASLPVFHFEQAQLTYCASRPSACIMQHPIIIHISFSSMGAQDWEASIIRYVLARKLSRESGEMECFFQKISQCKQRGAELA